MLAFIKMLEHCHLGMYLSSFLQEPLDYYKMEITLEVGSLKLNITYLEC